MGIPKVPHWTTIRQWALKMGLYEVTHKVHEKGKKWCALFDLTVDIGAIKCLLVLGIHMGKMQSAKDLTLSYSDVEVLGIFCTTKSNGNFIEQSLEQAEKAIGHPFAELLSDQGSDVVKGGTLYQEHSPKTVVIHDISHKMANVLEKAFKNDPQWKSFCSQLASTRLEVQQTTDLSALMPPKLRTKARYMSVDVLMKWWRRFQDAKKTGTFQGIGEDRLEKYFGWMEGFMSCSQDWQMMINIGEIIKEHVRKKGYSHSCYQELEQLINGIPTTSNRVIDFITSVMDAVWEEVERLKPRQVVLGDGRIIESLFGKFKETAGNGVQGITIRVLTIATHLAKKDYKEIKMAMEKVSFKEVIIWGKDIAKDSLASMRNKFFPHKKRNKNKGDHIEEMTA